MQIIPREKNQVIVVQGDHQCEKEDGGGGGIV